MLATAVFPCCLHPLLQNFQDLKWHDSDGKSADLGPTCLDFSPFDTDSSYVFVGCEDGSVYECQLLGRDRRVTRKLQRHDGTCSSLELSAVKCCECVATVGGCACFSCGGGSAVAGSGPHDHTRAQPS